MHHQKDFGVRLRIETHNSNAAPKREGICQFMGLLVLMQHLNEADVWSTYGTLLSNAAPKISSRLVNMGHLMLLQHQRKLVFVLLIGHKEPLQHQREAGVCSTYGTLNSNVATKRSWCLVFS